MCTRLVQDLEDLPQCDAHIGGRALDQGNPVASAGEDLIHAADLQVHARLPLHGDDDAAALADEGACKKNE